MSNLHQQKRLVLYADDDPDDLDFVRESFADYATEIELVTFPNAIQLLEFVHRRGRNHELPCLVIFDINMPLMSGKEALRIMRNIEGYEKVPTVLFTTSNAPYDAEFAGRYHAGFIPKPLSEKQMDIIVETFLEHCNEGIEKQ